ncbi:response regulator transcription factor [Streptomyces sp. MZ04]|uniref:response regulator n=1 Tax=Streptomyces sp. MZ04 TaxID=2559236 RepID=UPI00107E7480|nr:response regulator transcription factor [Streptomyces sp. MZ04]TGB08250.1 response regulator transcription factor [Streptomyces sp. MZ04]
MTIRVLLVDDQMLVRAGFKLLIDSEPGLSVVGEASEGSEAIEFTRALRPDVVLMDIRMPGMDGIAATKAITSDPELTDVKVVVLTTFGHDEYVFAALRAGASGFLMKDTAPDELVSAVGAVAKGDSLLLPRRTRHLIEDFVRRDAAESVPPAPELESLSERELEVLAVLARGLSNQEIADKLVLSPLTVKTHVSRILTKLGARDRAQLVVIAYESGLLVPGE